MNRFSALIAAALLSSVPMASAQVELKTYADSKGYIDVQKITCAQLVNTYQEDADFLGVWYRGWYNGFAKKHAINVPRVKEGIHSVIVHCKENRTKIGLYLLKGKPVLLYNLEGVARYRWEGGQALTPGKHSIAFDFKYDGPGFGKGGTGVLSVDGKEVARQTIPHSVPFAFGVDESLDIGSDTGTSVEDKDYQPLFAFNGALGKITIKLEPAQLNSSDQKAVQDKNGKRD